MARDRRTPRSSPEPVERQSRRRSVSSPRAWDNTLHLNISHAPTLIYNPRRRAVRSTSIFSPIRRESPSVSRSTLGRSNLPGNPLGNPRRDNQGPRSARAGSSPAPRRSHRSRGRVGRSNTPDWRAPEACVSGANCYPLGTAAYRPIRASIPVPVPAPARAPVRVAARQEPRHLTRSGRFPSSEVCRGTASGCCCWVCHRTPSPSRTPPPPYAVGSNEQSTQGGNPFRPGTVSWWDRSPLRNQE